MVFVVCCISQSKLNSFYVYHFTDIEKPRFEQCPGTLIFYPEDNEDIAYIHWDKPLVKDNKDSGLTAFQLSGPAPASQMGVNSYSIKYGASDRAGNEAVTCQFDVIVKRRYMYNVSENKAVRIYI